MRQSGILREISRIRITTEFLQVAGILPVKLVCISLELVRTVAFIIYCRTSLIRGPSYLASLIIQTLQDATIMVILLNIMAPI